MLPMDNTKLTQEVCKMGQKEGGGAIGGALAPVAPTLSCH